MPDIDAGGEQEDHDGAKKRTERHASPSDEVFAERSDSRGQAVIRCRVFGGEPLGDASELYRRVLDRSIGRQTCDGANLMGAPEEGVPARGGIPTEGYP